MDGMFGVNPNRHFQYLGCSGALVNDIRDLQIFKMQKSEVVLLSAGGNDANLANILNYCVYQWAAWPWWTCAQELETGESKIFSEDYVIDLTLLLQEVERKLASPNSRIYWTGYAQFFDDTTGDCDDVTCRNRFNRLTTYVNEKIQETCESVKRCVYVDPQPSIDQVGGRYCMPGVNEKYYGGVESPVDGWNRERTVFYEWSTTKDDDDDEEKKIDQPEKLKREEALPSTAAKGLLPLSNHTFEGVIGNLILEGTANGLLNVSDARSDEVSAEGLPYWVVRCFHLTKFGNGIVAMSIIDAMVSEQSKMMNEPADPMFLDLDSCPVMQETTETSPEDGTDTASIESEPTPPSAPPPAPPEAPYVVEGGEGAMIGKCHVHVTEQQQCGDDKHNLFAQVTIFDVGGNEIGFSAYGEAGAEKPLGVKSKLEAELIVIPQHQGDL
ncbi:MAG: hypothetical protein Q9184_007924, partial [Pyrenodesmia sp. 2 TL-2023]